MGHRDEIKPVAGQGERMRLHEQPTPPFIADDDVAADRNPLSANNGVNRVQPGWVERSDTHRVTMLK
jgi:hypothetical protein